MIATDPLLTITQAAEIVGVSRQRMHKLVKTYALSTIKAGPVRLIYRSELASLPAKRPSGRKISKKVLTTRNTTDTITGTRTKSR
jgi:excisionase family DNA binding protein